MEPIKIKGGSILVFNNLIANGGFETGTFADWSANNAAIATNHSHSGSYSAYFPAGNSHSSLTQTAPISAGDNVQLLISLAKFGFQRNPRIIIRIAYLDDMNTEVGSGLNLAIEPGTLPNVILNNWHEIYQVTDIAPANATQVRIEISKPMGMYFSSNVLIDDVSLLTVDSDVSGPPGPTGPTGTFVF